MTGKYESTKKSRTARDYLFRKKKIYLFTIWIKHSECNSPWGGSNRVTGAICPLPGSRPSSLSWPFELIKSEYPVGIHFLLVRPMRLELIRSPIRPSNVRVCLFRHNRIFHCERYYNAFRCICQHKLCPKVNIFLKLCKFPPFALLQGAKRAAFML